MENQSTPKLCECGCGQPTAISKNTDRYHGYEKGQARRFVRGHQSHRRPRRLIWGESLWRAEDRGFTTPCFIWLPGKDKRGYGRFSLGKKARLAHRIAYEAAYGPIPEGLTLDHLCRNPSCVRPDHLEAVTQAENARRGAGTKLSHASAAAIRALHRPGTPMHNKELAKIYGVKPAAIYRVLRGECWKQDSST